MTTSQEQLSEPLLSVEEQPTRPASRNVRLILVYTFLVFGGRSLWSQSVLSNFVYLLKNDNPEAVGFITAVMGLSQLVASFPSGVLADVHRRDVLLKAASVVGMCAAGVTLYSIHVASYQWLTIALAIWGIFWGIANTSLSALFADSIHEGDRSLYFTKRSILINVGNTTGPTVALLLFGWLGDTWTLHDCSVVMSVGQIVCLPALLLLCFLNDDHAIHDDNDELQQGLLIPTPSTTEDDSSYENDTSLDSQETSVDGAARRLCCCIPEHRYIPVLVALADVMSGLGSGMSIRYFPIFFLDNLQLSPVVVQVLYLVAPLGQASLMHVGQILSKRIGRCKMTVVFKWIGVTCMLTMVGLYLGHFPRYIVCIVYLLRTSFMNSTSALTKSVLMDAVPKHERGKWSALESVNMFSWSGSAAFGGLLVGFEGILFNFVVTAFIQFLATLPLIFLFKREGMEGERIRPTAIQTDEEEGSKATTSQHATNAE